MDSSNRRGAGTEDVAAVRARLLAALNGRLAELTGESSVAAARRAADPATGRGDVSTVGTGSFVAIGCTAVTLVVLAIGILVLVLTRWV